MRASLVGLVSSAIEVPNNAPEQTRRGALIFLQKLLSSAGAALLSDDVLFQKLHRFSGVGLIQEVVAWKDHVWFPSAMTAIFDIFTLLVSRMEPEQAHTSWHSLATELFSSPLGSDQDDALKIAFLGTVHSFLFFFHYLQLFSFSSFFHFSPFSCSTNATAQPLAWPMKQWTL